MKTRLSGLVDGELAKHEEGALFDSLKSDAALCRRWQEYLLIRDTLKGGAVLDTDITARVMQTLSEEPTVIAPRRVVPRQGWRRSALALAATLAGVAVVGWMALGAGQEPRLVATLAPQETAAVAQPVLQAARDMQEYLAAHEAQTSSLQFRGGTEHIRTVAAIRMASSK